MNPIQQPITHFTQAMLLQGAPAANTAPTVFSNSNIQQQDFLDARHALLARRPDVARLLGGSGVVLGSTNALKGRANNKVFGDVHQIGIRCTDATLGIPEQSSGLLGIYQDTERRLHTAIEAKKVLMPDAGLVVAIQSGVVALPDAAAVDGATRVYDVAMVMVETADGTRSVAVSGGIEFPIPDVIAVMGPGMGFALKTIGGHIAERLSVPKDDPHKGLTEGKLSRQDLIEQALNLALADLAQKVPGVAAIQQRDPIDMGIENALIAAQARLRQAEQKAEEQAAPVIAYIKEQLAGLKTDSIDINEWAAGLPKGMKSTFNLGIMNSVAKQLQAEGFGIRFREGQSGGYCENDVPDLWTISCSPALRAKKAEVVVIEVLAGLETDGKVRVYADWTDKRGARVFDGEVMKIVAQTLKKRGLSVYHNPGESGSYCENSYPEYYEFEVKLAQGRSR